MRARHTTAVLAALALVAPLLAPGVTAAGDGDDKSFQQLRFESSGHVLTIQGDGSLKVEHARRTIDGKLNAGERDALEAGALSDNEAKELRRRQRRVTVINLGPNRSFKIDIKKGLLHHLRYEGVGNIMDDQALRYLNAVLLGIVDRVTDGGVYGGRATRLEGTIVTAERATGLKANAVKTDDGKIVFLEGEFITKRAAEVLGLGNRVVVHGIVRARDRDQTTQEQVQIMELTRPPAPGKAVTPPAPAPASPGTRSGGLTQGVGKAGG